MSADQRSLTRASIAPAARSSTIVPSSRAWVTTAPGPAVTAPPSSRRAAVPPSSRTVTAAPPPRAMAVAQSSRSVTLVPSSRSSALPPALIQSHRYASEPLIVLVAFTGRITLADITSSRDFGNVVKSLEGKPFRVLCDFTQAITMPEEVCAVFIKGQEFAVARGMERDAFVSTSSVLRLQFARIARESGRIASLGPLRFFDSIAQAAAYLQV